MINLCVTVFNRHDLLRRMLESVAAGTMLPDNVFVIDHSYHPQQVARAVERTLPNVAIVWHTDPGLAYAWNWCLRTLHDDVVICNDDIVFEPTALERMHATPGAFVVTRQQAPNLMVAFILRRACIARVGWFDERLSPRYLYYEDCDYQYRMKLSGITPTIVEDAVVRHEHPSSTFKAYTPAQLAEHHKRFKVAGDNYVKKWGGRPGAETFLSPREL